LFPKAILNAYKYISLTDWEEAHYWLIGWLLQLGDR
jgi:hypothetical protein